MEELDQMSAKAILLAAGSGSRLMPYTSGLPKGLVPLAGKALLERQIDVLGATGVDDILLVGGYEFRQLERFDVPIVLNPDFTTTNMVASLYKTKDHFD